ncbi:hypothetical protein ACFLTO_04600 [Chloroflexota bacterium]
MKWVRIVMVLVLVCTVALLIPPQDANADTPKTWIGGEGYWNEDDNWSPWGAPEDFMNADIDGNSEIDSVVYLGRLGHDIEWTKRVTIYEGDTLIITPDARLDIESGGFLDIMGGTVINRGTINNDGFINNYGTFNSYPGSIFNNNNPGGYTGPNVVNMDEEPDSELPDSNGSTDNEEQPAVATGACEKLKTAENRRARYETLYALSGQELKAKGFNGGKEEVRKKLAETDQWVNKLRIECEGSITSGTGSGATPVPKPERPTKEGLAKLSPVEVQSAGEITDYYKRRYAEIAAEEVDTERQIASLTELRNEIDRLIEELIKGKDKINTKEVSGLVTKIEVRPGELKMDKAVVKTTDKRVVTRINNRDLEIKPTEKHVIIRDANYEVKAPELSIENEVLRVRNSEVKVMPSTVIERLQVDPKEIELREENTKAVYKIKAAEKRKLFGFIPVKIEKTLTVDALDAEVKTIDEKRSWWAFLTTGGDEATKVDEMNEEPDSVTDDQPVQDIPDSNGGTDKNDAGSGTQIQETTQEASQMQGTITEIDYVAKTVTIMGDSLDPGSATRAGTVFIVTSSTKLWLGGAPTSCGDLKSGMTVKGWYNPANNELLNLKAWDNR